MYKKQLHIICSYLLLIVFISWQTIISTHHHEPVPQCELVKNKKLKGVFHFHKSEIEKCKLCATLLDEPYLLNELTNVAFYPNPAITISVFKNIEYKNLFKYIKSRAPPQLFFV